MVKKKAQAWGMDLIIGSVIFMIGIMTFYVYTLNVTPAEMGTYEKINYDARILSSIILSQGYPKDWVGSTVVSPGIISNDVVNETKLIQLYDMIYTNNQYENIKNKMDTDYEFFFYFEGKNMFPPGDPRECFGMGNPDVIYEDGTMVDGTIKVKDYFNNRLTNVASIDYINNLVKVTRFVIYRNETLTVNFYVWEN